MFSVLFVLFLTILQIFADYEFDDTARFVTNSVCLPEDYNNKQVSVIFIITYLD